MKTILTLTLLASLCACGGGGYDDYECPVVTAENAFMMTNDLPPDHPCEYDYRVRENAPNRPNESKPLIPGG